MPRRLLLLVAVILSGLPFSALAETYYWKLTNYTGQFASAQEAMDYWLANSASSTVCSVGGLYYVGPYGGYEIYRFHSYSCDTGDSNGTIAVQLHGDSCATGTEWDPNDLSCITPAPTPEECAEQGDFYDPPSQTCVPICPNGSLNNSCLIQPDPQCTPSSGDYLGTAGFGDDQRYVCSGESTCPSGQSYAFSEASDGSYVGVCVSDTQNPPVCPGGFESVLEIYEDGFACGVTNEEATDPNRNNTSDGDSDGDGVADDTGMAGQLEDIKGLLKDGNIERSNIGQTVKKGFKDVTDAIKNIPGGGGGDSGSGKTEIVGEDGNAITWSGGAITMEVQDGLNELNAVQGEYETLIANIRSEMAASFGSFTGAGGLQDNNITLFGQTFNAGLSKFGADLSMIGSIILFAASFAALGIIMGARD